MIVKAFLLAGSALFLGFVPRALIGAEWCVDASFPKSGDGKTWETAFKTIQEGIDASFGGDSVIVAEGTFIENINFNGKNIVVTSTDPENKEVLSRTIIDGGQAGSVVTSDGTEDETCVLSGFTIRNGKADSGGGICGGTKIYQTHAMVSNSVVSGNSANHDRARASLKPTDKGYSLLYVRRT
jgi:hypothetical protein